MTRIMPMWRLIGAWLIVVVSVNCEDPEDTPPDDDEICDNGFDDDGDLDIDCNDSGCALFDACLSGDELCGSGEDDDGDGFVDCDDDDCQSHSYCSAPVEDCTNGFDDDGDGVVDCFDADCSSDPACVPPEGCSDGADDDGDGLIDCYDPDCDDDAACAELCNGEDDDGDGHIDENPVDPELGEACYLGLPTVAGVGQCDEGAIECFGGELTCVGWIPPAETELCDGLDNDCDGHIPGEELARGCRPHVIPGETSRIELQTSIRDVDVHFNVDTTGSMGGELDALRSTLSTTIVPSIREVLPTSEFGVSTFDDYPVDLFGETGDVPFTLHQRITSNVSMVQAVLDEIPLHGGGDDPESGIEALYQIATGDGTSWPAQLDCLMPAPGRSHATVAEIEPFGDIDAYSLSVVAGAVLIVDVDASEVGSLIDPVVTLIDQADLSLLASNDDFCGADSVLEYRTLVDVGMAIVISSYGETAGWYALRVDVDGDSYIASAEDCTGLEVGGEPVVDGVFAPSLAVPLVDASLIHPRPDVPSCTSDCAAILEYEDLEGWVATYCGGVTEGSCGDGAISADEVCDDGNTISGDGCSGTCQLERPRVPVFDWEDGYDAGLGHGEVGGVGFRATALPVIVHITDAVAHESTDYAGFDVEAHSSAEAFYALGARGARVVAVRSGAFSADPTDLLFPLGIVTASNALVPVCAFDESDGRLSGVCAEGECCAGVGGVGVPPNDDGLCPLVFEIAGDGSGLDASIVNAIDVLSQFVRYELTASPRDDPDDEVNAVCFVDAISILDFEGPPGSCAVAPETLDLNGDGVAETLRDATPRTRVTFEIAAVNQDLHDVDSDGDTEEVCASAGIYGLYLDVIAEGGTVVATRRLEVRVE